MQMTQDDIERFVDEIFPQVRELGRWSLEIDEDKTVLKLPIEESHLRPGATVSGPVLMTLVDTAVYFALISQIGPKALAVTTNLNINFMRKASTGVLLAEATLLKLGRRLAIGEVTITVEGDPKVIAHATATYSIPPV